MSNENKTYLGARHRANVQELQGFDAQPPKKRTPPKKKKKTGKRIFTAILSFFLVATLLLGGGFVGLYAYLKNGLIDESKVQLADPAFAPPTEWKGKVLNLLVIGLDNNEERGFAQGDGLTDMLLFVHWDLTTNSMSMLQVPRDSEVAGGLKVNSVLRLGPNKDTPVNNVLAVFNEQFLLPVDRYIVMDMDSLKELVDALGGLYINVTKTLDDYAGSRLEQGYHLLDGEQVEFFVRVRKGAGMDRSDIDRLENQRLFYAALFRRILELSLKDLFNLMPVINKYFITNFTVAELLPLAFNALRLKSENIVFSRVPVASQGGGWQPGNSGNLIMDLYGRDEENPGLAAILNTYFRTLDSRAPIDAASLGLPQHVVPAFITVYPPGIQSMGELEGGEAA